ncbi:MAG TPA: J domain-containing protein [Pyrinomonadaceae bacterium]|nr:J domain-containing protein [Pyrinomonadaceae bacterium]
MMDQSKCYEILGVRPGVSPQELKTAHRDLAKVWHPDRFAHDPRLQAKAQEKLKEINEAFDQLISKGKRRPVATPRSDQGAYHESRKSRRSSRSHSSYWPGLLIALLMFSLVFFFTLRSIRRNQQQAQISVATEQTEALEVDEQSDNQVDAERIQSARVKNRTNEQSESIPQQTGEHVTAVQPMPTATVTIDPLTGKVARRECPTKRTMTYPKGNEPREYCDVHKPLPPLQAEREPPNESRIKSVTKRLVSPSKW